ncbi:Ribosome biogenesis protein ERB1 [Balamuthia mandrillaris]
MAVAWKNATQAVHSPITGLDVLALPSDEKGFFALNPPLVFPPPTISLSHPSAEEDYFEEEAVEARAEEQDNFNTILRVEFFHNGQLWSTLKERPYKLMTAGLPQGEHSFQVVAYFTGGPFHSDVTTISVQAPLPPDEDGVGDGDNEVDSEDSEFDGDVDSEDSEVGSEDSEVDSEDSEVGSDVDSSDDGSEEDDEEDSYSSFSSSEEDGKEEGKSNTKVVIIAASAGGGAILVAAAAGSTVGFFIWRRRNRLGKLLEIQLQPRHSVPSQRAQQDEDDGL